MEPAVVCYCSSMLWLIGESGIRCAECLFFITDLMVYTPELDATATNENIKAEAHRQGKHVVGEV